MAQLGPGEHCAAPLRRPPATRIHRWRICRPPRFAWGLEPWTLKVRVAVRRGQTLQTQGPPSPPHPQGIPTSRRTHEGWPTRSINQAKKGCESSKTAMESTATASRDHHDAACGEVPRRLCADEGTASLRKYQGVIDVHVLPRSAGTRPTYSTTSKSDGWSKKAMVPVARGNSPKDQRAWRQRGGSDPR